VADWSWSACVPDTKLLTATGASIGPRGAVVVDETMATGLPRVWAAGDCVHHRLLGLTYLPLGTTAHSQGRVAGENAIGGQTSSQTTADDHKAYYPGASPITIRITGDLSTGQQLGAQLVRTRGTETAKRVDTYATAVFHAMTVDRVSDLDLSYTPPLGSHWDAVQTGARPGPVSTTSPDSEPACAAFVLQRPRAGGDSDGQTVVVELVRDRQLPDHRWCALAADELRGWWTPLSHGRTAGKAIAGIAWDQSDLCRRFRSTTRSGTDPGSADL
jgi:Pyridine nucleotide-disulphide oxidoreductase